MSSQFEPNYAGYRQKVIESFSRQEVMKTVNASILKFSLRYLQLHRNINLSLTSLWPI
ncbi:hypothetical protein D1AOALGA4SA_5505 [Olavius algarvensis Delta 1 endosymbiont]|nr:hypothetical protein D1AOALGA4SA_5505 [Olavius algarvensis Delta 1 endosymbiont]